MTAVTTSAAGRSLPLTIDGQAVSVPEGTTLLEACRVQGIATPTLCYLENLRPVNVCRVCVVEVEGSRALVLHFRIDVTVRLPLLGKYIGHLQGPCDGPQSLLTMLPVWCDQTSTETALGCGWIVLRRRPAGVGSLPNRQSHWV